MLTFVVYYHYYLLFVSIYLYYYLKVEIKYFYCILFHWINDQLILICHNILFLMYSFLLMYRPIPSSSGTESTTQSTNKGSFISVTSFMNLQEIFTYVTWATIITLIFLDATASLDYRVSHSNTLGLKLRYIGKLRHTWKFGQLEEVGTHRKT